MKRIYLTIAAALFFTLTYSQGNDCASATELLVTGQGSSVSGNTSSSGDNGGNNSNDVFYFISPNSIQTVNVELCLTGPSRDTKLTVYSDCSLTTIIAENDDGGSDGGFDNCGLQGKLSFQSDGTSTYIIMVEGADDIGASGREGPFEISLWYGPAFTLPQTPVGVNCTPSASGAAIIFSEEFDDNSEGWIGDITVNGHNSGDWEINGNGIHSADTGPSGVDSNTVGSSYMSYESSLDPGDGSTETASAVSSAIDLSGSIVEDVELSFYMHAYGIRMGTLNVGISTDGAGGPFTNEFTWIGQLQSIETQDWVQVGIDLVSYLGQTIYIEFEMTGTGNFHSDMAIDLVEVAACDTVLEVEEDDLLDNVSLYPNPANDIINIRSQEIIDEIKIYNLIGQEVLRLQPKQMQIQIDLESLSIGVYVVKVQVGNQIGSYRIVKQ